MFRARWVDVSYRYCGGCCLRALLLDAERAIGSDARVQISRRWTVIRCQASHRRKASVSLRPVTESSAKPRMVITATALCVPASGRERHAQVTVGSPGSPRPAMSRRTAASPRVTMIPGHFAVVIPLTAAFIWPVTLFGLVSVSVGMLAKAAAGHRRAAAAASRMNRRWYMVPPM